jgi:hypothetical protein
MTQITREIHIDATPGTVRRLVSDPSRRARWLDEPAADPIEEADGTWTYTRDPDDAPPSRVRIEVLPDGHGSRVRVTEDVIAPEAAGDTDVVALLPPPRRDDGAPIERGADEDRADDDPGRPPELDEPDEATPCWWLVAAA